MRALVYEGPDHLVLRRRAIPRPGQGEVLIRIATATICGTDVRIVSGRKKRDVRPGHPIGHECAGTVEACGAGVDSPAPGDRIAVHPVVSCGECPLCRSDRENLCPARITLGYHTDGAFAEFMLIPAHAVRRGNLFHVPDPVPLETASLLEPMACCINGQDEMGLFSGATTGSVLIVGAGPIGLLHLMSIKARSSRPVHITMLEPNPLRQAAAQTLGADETAAPQGFVETESFDAVILAVGDPLMVNVALQAVRKAGRVSLFAGFDHGMTVPIDLNAIHYKQVRIHGASESRRRDYGLALDLVTEGRLNPAQLITHRFRLQDHQQAFQRAADGSGLKVAFQPL